MNRSWTTIILVTGLTGLLVLLGSLQYRWLTQISESDGEKARARVKEQAERFAMDFNREIQNAYFNFQTGADAWKAGDWRAFNERLDYWREKTTYPDLITEFYFFEAKPEAAPLRYDRTDRLFKPTDLTDDLAALRLRFADDKTFQPIYEDSYTLVLPIHDDARKDEGHIFVRTRIPDGPVPMNLPPKYGYLVIKLDPATITGKVLPDLTVKYFGDGEYRTAVVDRAGQGVFQSIAGETSDATAPLFDVSADNFIFYGNKDLMSSIDVVKRQGTLLNSRIESHTLTSVLDNTDKQGGLKVELKRESLPRTSVFTATTTAGGEKGGRWTLLVQHSSGSLGAYLTGRLRQNLAIGFGILVLLAGAIAAIVLSAQRARMLAQRQVDFVSSVSHEFRTPLAVIYSAGENLADGVAKEDGQVSRYGDLIKGEGRKLTAMVEQILDFAGANSGRKKYNFDRAAAREVLASAIDACRPMLDEQGIVVETSIADPLPAINADRAALSRAIQNLIVNSVKYGGREKWLRVSAENGGGRMKISVEDRGIGISKQDLRQVFEPFYRSKTVVDAQIHGNGLGLALVKQIVEAHGGTVTADSVVGEGSKFTIEMPSEKGEK